ncbi:MAG: chemotaxis protein CheW [Treponema sp.]|nr:chemotaxis protein CheW [Treponema sp.]
MATIQEKLSAFASTTEDVSKVSLNAEEKARNSIIDYRMVTFSLAGKDYAIDIRKVKEIVKAGNFTYVPNSLPFVLGVYNLRGEIIPIIDLRLFFNIEVPPHDDNKMENMLVVTVGEQMFGVVVDAIDNVVGIQQSTIQPPHPLFGDINIKYIYGVAEAAKHLYILLDIDTIFGIRTPEEEQKLAETAKVQMERRKSLAAEANAEISESSAVSDLEDNVTDEDLKFITESLLNQKKFTVNAITKDWVNKRYLEWKKQRGSENTQIQNDSDAEAFLKPFYSRCNCTWWTEAYSNEILNALPDNNAKNIIVWNAGCNKGYESYSLACILKKKYPNANIRIYAHDIDLLNVSNAPLLTLSEEASRDWYQPYLSRTVSGDYTFNKEIKDTVMFEYHDCVNTSNLSDIDIIFARDIISFLPENSQKTMLTEFKDQMKGNGVVIVGDNEDITAAGFKKKSVGNVAVYSK